MCDITISISPTFSSYLIGLDTKSSATLATEYGSVKSLLFCEFAASACTTPGVVRSIPQEVAYQELNIIRKIPY